jgi:solute carrier family 25 citrate transporter 1
MSSSNPKKSPYKHLIAGGIAGAIEATVMFPTEFVKTQLQLQQSGKALDAAVKYKGPIDVVKRTVSEKGILALYRGLSTLVVGTFAKAGIRFYSYHHYSELIFPKNKSDVKPYHSMLAGLAAGMTEAVLAVTPTETIKTKLIQDQNQASPRYRGLIHGTRMIFKEEGFAGIYRGLFPTMARQGANSAIRFTVFAQMQGIWLSLDPNNSMNKTIRSFISGGIAGTASTLLTMPIDVVKTRMQGLNAKQYAGSLDCARQIFMKETVFSFWAGTTPRLSRVVLSSSIVFSIQDFIVRNWV